MRPIRKIVVHCADTPVGKEFDASDIHQWHRERGWDGIGYHEVIKTDGEIEHGRPWYWVGSHVRGHNGDSIGICLIGRESFTDAQFESLRDVIRSYKERFPHAVVCGHNDLDDSKTCPNFDVADWWCKV